MKLCIVYVPPLQPETIYFILCVYICHCKNKDKAHNSAFISESRITNVFYNILT